VQACKRLTAVLVILFFGTTLWARPNVVATIYPLYLLLKDVGDGRIESSYVLGPYTSPHGYELTPRAFLKLKKADAVVAVGCGLDDWLGKAAAGKRVFRLCQGVELVEGNPHIWLSPSIVARKVWGLARFLSGLDPEDAQLFRKRAEFVASRLSTLTERSGKRCAVISHHNAWLYLIKDLGYDYIGAIEEVPHQEPTPGHIQRLIRRASGRACVLVIAEKGHNLKVAELVAKKLKARLVVLNPLGDYGDRGFVEFMKRLISAIRDAE